MRESVRRYPIYGARHARHLSVLAGALCTFASTTNVVAVGQKAAVNSDLEFHSSDAQLNQSFHWAKEQALAYVRPETSPIGPWYEAALPGRNAFCMRDVSHQTTGAAALGLYQANRNMLARFAGAVAPSRDWAGYWEIDQEGKPSSADYVSDSDFWYNLPSNFDVLDAVVRMWRWTGDDSYRDDPGFQFFFRKTMTDYVQLWQLWPNTILNRPRIANQKLVKGKFIASRGIPSYTEGPKDFMLGADLLAAEYRAMRSYKEVAAPGGDKELAARIQATGDQVQDILEAVAWSNVGNHFNEVIRKDLSGFGSGDTMALYFDAVKSPAHIQGALAYVAAPQYWKKINIEEESYVPAVLFHYGCVAAAYQILFDLTSPNKPRREYPEVSYAVIAAIVTGAMGVEPSHPSDPYDVQTLPQPMTRDENLSLTFLHINANLIDIADHGEVSSQLLNRQGPLLRWRAAFKGDMAKIYVNGRPIRAEHGTTPGRVPISWITTTVKPGSSVVVSRISLSTISR